MHKEKIHYLRCPYCGPVGGHGKTVGKRVGLFRIKELYNNVLIFECQKCLRVFRKMTVGSTLGWKDLSVAERKAFRQREFVSYKIQLNPQGGKNGNKTK